MHRDKVKGTSFSLHMVKCLNSVEEGSHLQNHISVHSIVSLNALACVDAARAGLACKERQAGQSTCQVLFPTVPRVSPLNRVAHRLALSLQMHRPADHNLVHNAKGMPSRRLEEWPQPRLCWCACCQGRGLRYTSNFQGVGAGNKRGPRPFSHTGCINLLPEWTD